MQSLSAILSIFLGLSIAFPLVLYLIFKRAGNLKEISGKIWLLTFIIAFLFFPLFFFRKHWERALYFFNSNFWFTLFVTQMDNNFWEEFAKLLVFLIFLKPLRNFLKKSGESTLFGYWIGLAYGIGEAVTLSLIALFPKINVWGYSLFLLFITWKWVWERFIAIQVHAIMGAIIGTGVFYWAGLRKKFMFFVFFIISMLYHELVDGVVLTMMYFPDIKLFEFLARNIYTVTLPALLIIGYIIWFGVYKISKKQKPLTIIHPDLSG